MKTPVRGAMLAALLFTVFLGCVGFGLIVPFLPGVGRELGASDFVAMVLGTVYGGMLFITSRTWGQLSDRYGRRPILLASVTLSAIGLITLWLADSVAWLVVARLVGGAAAGNGSVVSAYIADATTEEDRGRGMGYVGAIGGVGFILGPALGGVLEAYSPLEREGALSALVCVGLTVVNFGLVFAYLPESLPPERRSTGPMSLSPVHIPTITKALRVAGIPILGMVFLMRSLAIQSLHQAYLLFVSDETTLGVAHVGAVLAVVGVIIILMQGLAIRPLLRIASEVRLVTIGLPLEAVGYLLIGLAPALVPEAAPLLFCANALIAVGGGVADPLLASIGSKSAPKGAVGETMGTLASARAVGMILGPIIHGALYQGLGHALPFFFAAACCTAMVVPLTLLSRTLAARRVEASS